MERLFNSGWQFVKKAIGTKMENHINETGWQDIDLPHDYLIYQVNDLYETSIGWYRKKFFLDKEKYDLSTQQIAIRFDGVYMNSTFYVNNKKVGEWKYGYTAFEYDITNFLNYGDNELFMEVVYECPNTRWYSGAGIYRDVTLITRPHLHFSSEGIYVSTVEKDDDFILSINVEIEKSLKKMAYSPCGLGIDVLLKDTDGNIVINEQYDLSEFDFEMEGANSWANENETENEIVYSGSRDFFVASPKRWDIYKPNLYELKVSLVNLKTGEHFDEKIIKTGFKSVGFDTDLGLIINGHKVKVHGSCEHHDLGCLGSAFNKEAMRIRMLHLQDMGVNAIRTAHNPAARHLLDLADELGMLVMDEILDMWEKPKTEYDYARFFNTWIKKDIKSWIRRDRNHPSVFMWSIGNEIYDTHASYERGVEIIRMFKEEISKYDPFENAHIT
ncbi:MAG: glycoside hydrolase family 2, partial [Lachnospiraceae bacterium]|nr:glycoside hydrolase family 2 [Lachnospiraceae bacterium]